MLVKNVTKSMLTLLTIFLVLKIFQQYESIKPHFCQNSSSFGRLHRSPSWACLFGFYSHMNARREKEYKGNFQSICQYREIPQIWVWCGCHAAGCGLVSPDSPPQQQDASGSQKLHVDRLGLNFARARTQPRRFHLLNSRTLTKSPPGSGKFVGHTEREKTSQIHILHACSVVLLESGSPGLTLQSARAHFLGASQVSPTDKSEADIIHPFSHHHLPSTQGRGEADIV